MPNLTPFILLLTSLSLTTPTTPPSTNTSSPSAAAAASASASLTFPPPSAASLAADNLPGGTANPALTLLMYADPACTSINDTYTTLVNALPLSYGVPSPQIPFWSFVMTRNLTGTEMLTFYSSTNASADACAAPIGNLTAADGGAGYCLQSGGATCYNLTKS